MNNKNRAFTPKARFLFSSSFGADLYIPLFTQSSLSCLPFVPQADDHSHHIRKFSLSFSVPAGWGVPLHSAGHTIFSVLLAFHPSSGRPQPSHPEIFSVLFVLCWPGRTSTFRWSHNLLRPFWPIFHVKDCCNPSLKNSSPYPQALSHPKRRTTIPHSRILLRTAFSQVCF